MNPTSNDFLWFFPTSGSGPGIMVLHAWWGLNGFMREFCQRLADEGYVVLAPDMFHGKIAKTIGEAEKLSQSEPGEEVAKQIFGAYEELSQAKAVTSDRLGVIGFSYGAWWAVWLAGVRPAKFAAVTVFYGTSDADISQSKAAFQGHFAESDPFESLSNVEAMETYLQKNNRPVDFHVYPATGHWFFEKDRLDAYNQPAADLAWQRTRDFLKTHLR